MCVGEGGFPPSPLMFMPISGSICGKQKHVFRQLHGNIFSPMLPILQDNIGGPFIPWTAQYFFEIRRDSRENIACQRPKIPRRWAHRQFSNKP